jgi:hypothetical protein
MSRWIFVKADAAAVLWAPDSLSDLVAWYKADAITGLSDDDPVSTWTDSSASGWNASESTTHRPTYKTNILNSKPIVRFSGTNNLSLGSVDMARNVAGVTVYSVVSKDNTSGSKWVLFCSGTGASTARVALQSGSSTWTGVRRLSSDTARLATAATNIPATTWTVFGAVVDFANGDIEQYINGTLDGTNTTFSTGNSENTAAANVRIGSDAQAYTAPWDGDIAEVLVVHTAVSATDREKIEGYLAHKWGLESSLPAGHAYKSAAPTV